MKVDVVYDGSSYPVGFDDISLAEAFRIKELTGLPLAKFQPAIFDFDPDAVLALVALALGRGGKHVKVKDIDHAKVDLPRLIENVAAAIDTALVAQRAGREAQQAAESLSPTDDQAAG